MLPKSQLAGALYNWTDALPLCKQSGVGYQTNLVYRAGGGMGAMSEYEDRSFHFSCPGGCFLYGVLDGHDGTKVADFAGQRLPAELLLGQLMDDFDDTDVKLRLQEAFESVSKGFVEDLINDPLMQKMNLEEQLPVDMSPSDAKKRFPSLFQHLEELEKRITGGCSAVIALIHKSRLFVANVGDAKALFCRIDSNGDVGVVQLSTDHTLATVSELQRLDQLGLDIESLQVHKNILRTTRSLGDWGLKGGYKMNPNLSIAKEEPILSVPSVHGGEDISGSMKFLILMTKGVYTAYEQAANVAKEEVNNCIANLVYKEITKQTTIESVAQSVVDQICRLHHDQFVQSENQTCLRRDDMTLLVRLFNIELSGGKKEREALSRMARQSANLTPLKMPAARTTTTSPKPDTPSSTEGSTPKTTTPDSSTTSPVWAPTVSYSGNAGGVQVQSPLAVTVVCPESVRYQSSILKQPQEQQPQRENLESKLETLNLDSKASHNVTGGAISRPEPPLVVAKPGSILPSIPSVSSMDDKTQLFNRPEEPLETDEEGRIKAYTSFREFQEKILAAGGEKTVFAEFLRIT